MLDAVSAPVAALKFHGAEIQIQILQKNNQKKMWVVHLGK